MKYRFGMWAASAALVASVAYGIPQLLQLAGVLVDPWDRILIFAPSLALAPAFVLTMVAVHGTAPADRQTYSLAALALAIMYGVMACIVYVTQLGVVIPHDLRGDGARYALLACCGQNQLMTGIDLVGYTLMSMSLLCAAPVFSGSRAIRLWLLANGALAPFLFLQLAYPRLIYVGALWLVTFPAAMLLLALWFRDGRAVGHRPRDLASS